MSNKLDRFAAGRPDPQQLFADLVGYCVICGSEIYPDDDVYEVDGVMLCDQTECLLTYTGARKVAVKELIK